MTRIEVAWTSESGLSGRAAEGSAPRGSIELLGIAARAGAVAYAMAHEAGGTAQVCVGEEGDETQRVIYRAGHGPLTDAHEDLPL